MEVAQEQEGCGGRDQPLGLGEGARAGRVQLVGGLGPEAGDGAVVQARGQGKGAGPGKPPPLNLCACKIGRIESLGLKRLLLAHSDGSETRRRGGGKEAPHSALPALCAFCAPCPPGSGGKKRQAGAGGRIARMPRLGREADTLGAQAFAQASIRRRRLQPRAGFAESCGPTSKGAPALGANQALSQPPRGQAQIRVVGAQAQAVLGPGGEHPVGLAERAACKVIHEDAEVGLMAGEDQALARA